MADKKILITGGAGALGKHLTTLLLAKGYSVAHLSRGQKGDPRVETYSWDVDRNYIDERCVEGVDTIVHLAGAGIADKRWTEQRKQLVIESRTKSIALLYNLLKNKPNTVQAVVSASGIGYYSDRGDELLTEQSAPANDFLGRCCVLWEQAVDEGKALGLRVSKFRTGVVLDKRSGALPQLAAPVKWAVGSPLGSGKQWIPWIHWHDVAAMYLYAIENKLEGVFNMVAPNPVTNKQLTQLVAKQLHRPLLMLNVPSFAIKLVFGEMATLVLGSTKVSAEKIQSAGFKFKYPTAEKALTEIYG